MTTLANAIRDAATRLPGDEARLEAELLLAHALQRPRSWFYAHSGDVLDPGEAMEAAEQLRAGGFEVQARQVLADAHGRRHTMVAALITIARGMPPTDHEETILDRALKHLDTHHDGVPVEVILVVH